MQQTVVRDNNNENRFSFGENWLEYLKCVDESRIQEAIASLQKFLKPKDCIGKTFLDIGCGSGLFSLAAIRLGFAKVMSIDIDPASVHATTVLLSNHAAAHQWSCQQISVFDVKPENLEYFDVVYSWGVLHHTGDMWRAIKAASSMVKPNGQMILALYRKTLLCGFWHWEKRLYNNGPKWFPMVMQKIFKSLFYLRLIITRKNIQQFMNNYQESRGMNWHHDVIDWLGGYPYESVHPTDLKNFAKREGFELVNEITQKQAIGFFGAGCDEFHFVEIKKSELELDKIIK